MTEEEKIGKHIYGLIQCFNDYYKEYRLRYAAGKGDKRTLCRVLAGCAFGIAQDFNELEKILSEVQNDSRRDSKVGRMERYTLEDGN